MNNIFNIKRFWQTLRHDIVYTASKNGASIVLAPMAVLLVTAMLVTTFGLILDEDLITYPFIRLLVIIATYSVMMLLMASRCFGYLTDGKHNVSYLMLPASTLEKTLSICIIYYIIVPVMILLSSYTADSLLTLVKFGGFDSYMTPQTISGICTNDYNEMPMELKSFIRDTSLSTVLGHYAMLSYILLCALVFKRHKVLKTIGIYFGANIVTGTVLSSAIIRTTANYDTPFNFESVYLSTMTWSIIIGIAFIIAFNVGIYFTLQKMKS